MKIKCVIAFLLMCRYPEGFDYFWMPLVATHVGGIAGSWTYLLFIGNHFSVDDDSNSQDNAEPDIMSEDSNSTAGEYKAVAVETF